MKTKRTLFIILIIAIAIYYFLIDPSRMFLNCPIYATVGIYCPGCGSQRALYDLLHLNIIGVFEHNLLFAFGVMLVAYQIIITSINSVFNKNIKNLLYHKKTPIVILIIVVIFWILRNITKYPFNWLAPN
ncbi:MAG: DUF2752 domain-containing protein [Urechidicola sp.]|nr:DUF2752 domain-containing protein [Urechidicola sp.]